jgi:hypothetical protein
MSALLIIVVGLFSFAFWRQLVALLLVGVVILMLAGVAFFAQAETGRAPGDSALPSPAAVRSI